MYKFKIISIKPMQNNKFLKDHKRSFSYPTLKILIGEEKNSYPIITAPYNPDTQNREVVGSLVQSVEALQKVMSAVVKRQLVTETKHKEEVTALKKTLYEMKIKESHSESEPQESKDEPMNEVPKKLKAQKIIR
ncbi:MAG: hypothetical protein HRT90_00125 [Candidatus Margulisbacteria bacterium]|nr:hypothetical protein [Candidatus Margulisiibacteriota bacterium]